MQVIRNDGVRKLFYVGYSNEYMLFSIYKNQLHQFFFKIIKIDQILLLTKYLFICEVKVALPPA